ncbi:MAG: Two-component transcriptional response regulator, LuxR family, partial [uncultured Corynebacteriales bacterium]
DRSGSALHGDRLQPRPEGARTGALGGRPAARRGPRPGRVGRVRHRRRGGRPDRRRRRRRRDPGWRGAADRRHGHQPAAEVRDRRLPGAVRPAGPPGRPVAGDLVAGRRDPGRRAARPGHRRGDRRAAAARPRPRRAGRAL